MAERRPALLLELSDNQGRDLGGIILLDQGNRQLTCDWFGTCTHLAIAAVVPSTSQGAPQLACAGHLPNIYASVWKHANPPRIHVKDGARLLARNDKASS